MLPKIVKPVLEPSYIEDFLVGTPLDSIDSIILDVPEDYFEFYSDFGVADSFVSLNPLTPELSESSFLCLAPVEVSSWLDSPSETKPVRAAAKVEEDATHINVRRGGSSERFNTIGGLFSN
jgi:hypothetical protein